LIKASEISGLFGEFVLIIVEHLADKPTWSVKCKVELQIELLRSNSRLGSLIILSDIVHTGGESLQDGLRDVQTCETTLASAFVLHHLSTTWSQFQIIRGSPRWEWVLIWYIAIEHQRSSSIRSYLHWLPD